MRRSLYAFLLAPLLLLPPRSGAEAIRSPAEVYGELFEQVQLQRVFEDGKTFVDAVPVRAPEEIRADYGRERKEPGFELKAFVEQNFELPRPVSAQAPELETASLADVNQHIDRLWPLLTRKPDAPPPHSSLLPLPYPYVVPGGRFREIYYWDSYFTMIGLEESGRHELTRSMLRNFAHLIDTHGHVPNGNRTYYLSRSQPPFFAAMVELVAHRDGDETYRTYLAQLEREYAFWMQGADKLARNAAHRRVVRLADGSILNRYWDDRATPREESYRHDVEAARASGRPVKEVYRNLRAAAESGWDFSSRWFADGRKVETIRTVDIVPIDLNSLLYRLELTLAKGHRAAGDEKRARAMGARAWARRQAVQKYLWNEEQGAFGDYDWRRRRLTPHLTAATLYPLFFGLATHDQSGRVAQAVRKRLLQPDGLATTLVRTGEQWDAPNGWAPLQWIGIEGLRNSGEPDLAREIACRWIRENEAAFVATGKLMEKYDVSGSGEAGGGEYPNQDGFGWTNGVLRKLRVLYPATACQRRAA